MSTRIEDRLAEERRREHPNPLAGRGPELARAATSRRQRRMAGAGGLVAAAAVAVAVAVPGPWRTPDPQDSPPVPAEELCGMDLDELRPQQESDLYAAILPRMDGAELSVGVGLGNMGQQPRVVRSAGNEIVLVDIVSNEVVAHWADLDQQPDLTIAVGETATLEESPELRYCGDVPDGQYLMYARGAAGDGAAWMSSPYAVNVFQGRVSQTELPDREPESASAVAFDVENWSPDGGWQPPEVEGTGIEVSAQIDAGPHSTGWADADAVTATVTITNGSDQPFRAQVVPWLLLTESPEAVEQPVAVTSTPPWDSRVTVDLQPGESVEVPLVQEVAQTARTETADGIAEYQGHLVLLDAGSFDPGSGAMSANAGDGTAFVYAGTGPFEISLDWSGAP